MNQTDITGKKKWRESDTAPPEEEPAVTSIPEVHNSKIVHLITETMQEVDNLTRSNRPIQMTSSATKELSFAAQNSEQPNHRFYDNMDDEEKEIKLNNKAIEDTRIPIGSTSVIKKLNFTKGLSTSDNQTIVTNTRGLIENIPLSSSGVKQPSFPQSLSTSRHKATDITKRIDMVAPPLVYENIRYISIGSLVDKKSNSPQNQNINSNQIISSVRPAEIFAAPVVRDIEAPHPIAPTVNTGESYHIKKKQLHIENQKHLCCCGFIDKRNGGCTNFFKILLMIILGPIILPFYLNYLLLTYCIGPCYDITGDSIRNCFKGGFNCVGRIWDLVPQNYSSISKCCKKTVIRVPHVS